KLPHRRSGTRTDRAASAKAVAKQQGKPARAELRDQPGRYRAVYRPAVLRANRLTPSAKLSPDQSFHSLRHTYASLCVAAGIPASDMSRFMGHAKPTTTPSIYAHLFEDNHARDGCARRDGPAEDEGGQCRGDAGAAMNAGEVARFCRVRRNRKVPATCCFVGYASQPERSHLD